MSFYSQRNPVDSKVKNILDTKEIADRGIVSLAVFTEMIKAIAAL